MVFPRSRPAQALLHVADHHEMVLCDRNITELRDILGRKAPKFLPDAEVLVAEMSYELVPAINHAEKLIRDAKDQPILNAAIVSDVDIDNIIERTDTRGITYSKARNNGMKIVFF